MSPTISIIVPVYNVEKYLRQCIESILNQKYQDFELILVNDGSTDLSKEICEEYLKKDRRIKLENKKNGGLSSARNVGLNVAVGEYIGFIDSDDWIHEDMYERLVNHAIDHKSDIVACNLLAMDRNGIFKSFNRLAENQEFNRTEAMMEIYKNKVLTFSSCNKIFNKNLFNELRFVEGIILEDKDISYKLIDKANRISYIKDSLYYYRYNNKSILRSSFSIKRIDEFKVQLDMYNYYKENYFNISDLIYYDLFILGLYLYSETYALKVETKNKYKYLIEFDKEILIRLIKNNEISLMQKLKAFIGVVSPYFLVFINRFRNKLRTIVN
ncbi:MAG: glycosyltransferase family 2 protein [Carnobacterium sp.]|uniref:glycosyltransferase family 2 protein n=1 Tax=Carnobacterium sp. TaxID=48221 RepID=UPI003C787D1A